MIEIRGSQIEGKGVFAAHDIKPGEEVYSYPTGKIISLSEVQGLPEYEKRYLDDIGSGKFEIIEPPARYVNHSCDPNVYEKERTAYALRDIQKSEEITIDYDKIAYLNEPFTCACGAKNCRGSVRGKGQ